MKNILTVFLLILSFTVYGQKVVNLGVLSPNSNAGNYGYIAHKVSKGDTLTLKQKTITFLLQPNKHYAYTYNVNFAFDTIAGADTLVKVVLSGKLRDADAWTVIKKDSVDVNSATYINFSTLGQICVMGKDSVFTTLGINYRYLKADVIYMNKTGTEKGVKLTGADFIIRKP